MVLVGTMIHASRAPGFRLSGLGTRGRALGLLLGAQETLIRATLVGAPFQQGVRFHPSPRTPAGSSWGWGGGAEMDNGLGDVTWPQGHLLPCPELQVLDRSLIASYFLSEKWVCTSSCLGYCCPRLLLRTGGD